MNDKITYLDYVRNILPLTLVISLNKSKLFDEAGVSSLIGIDVTEDVEIKEIEINKISINYELTFHNFKKQTRIYFNNNMSPNDCLGRYFTSISDIVNDTLYEEDREYLIRKFNSVEMEALEKMSHITSEIRKK